MLWIDDPLDGLLLAVGGGAPGIVRVIAARAGLGQYVYASPDHDRFDVRTCGLFLPPTMARYRTVCIFRRSALPPVDLLLVLSGSYAAGDQARQFFLLQGQSLELLSERQLRQALGSPWLARIRMDQAEMVRAITVRD